MYFSFNKQTLQKAPLGKALMFAAAVSLSVMLSGCSGQTNNLDANKNELTQAPNVDQAIGDQDFLFPSTRPSLMKGREIFLSNCVQCHAQGYWQTDKVKRDLAYTTPIDMYLMLTSGKKPHHEDLVTAERKQLLPASHSAFGKTINRDDRWAVIFYTRYLAGAGDVQSPDPKTDIAGIFGGNCAVCHGSKGQGDGFLHTGKTGNHELHDATQLHNLNPAPANFQQYGRMYNRTDAQLLKYVCEGIYPSAMPAWFGNINLDKDTGKPTYVFDEQLILNLVRYVRAWSYENDLNPELPEVKNPPPGLNALDGCKPVATNRPFNNAMTQYGPKSNVDHVEKPADAITGGMILPPYKAHSAVNQQARNHGEAAQ